MHKIELEQWRQTRDQGETKYVWTHGVLLWGMSSGIIWLILIATFGSGEFGLWRLTIALVVFPIIGYLYGKWSWKNNELRYLKATNSRQDQSVKM